MSKSYAFSIRTEEIFHTIGTEKSEKLIKILKSSGEFIAVWQEPSGIDQVFLFKTSDARTEACSKAQEIGFKTAAIMHKSAYVDG